MIVLLPLFFGHTAWSFNGEKIDSLRKALVRSKEDTSKVNVFYDLGFELLRSGNYDSVASTAVQMRKLAQHIGMVKGEGLSWILVGQSHLRTSQYDSALNDFRRAKNIFATLNDFTNLATTSLYIGQAYDFLASYREALTNYGMALDHAKKTSNKQLQANILNSTGVTLANIGNYRDALENYLAAAKISSERGASRYYAGILNNIGAVYQQLSQYHESDKYYDQFLEVARRLDDKYFITVGLINKGEIYKLSKEYARSMSQFTEAIKIQEKTGDNRGLSLSYTNLGDIYRYQGDFIQSEFCYNKSLALAESIKNKDLMQRPLMGLVDLGISMGHFREAQVNIDRATALAQASNFKQAFTQIFLNRSKLDSARGDFKNAYRWHQSYTRIKDSLLNVQNTKQIIQMRELYESEKKDKEILRLNEASHLENLNRKHEERMFNLVSLFSTLIILILIFWLMVSARYSKRLKKEKNRTTLANHELEKMVRTIEEQKNILAQKNESLQELHNEKDGLIGIVAHDLRSPLNRIQGLTMLLPLSGELNRDQSDLTVKIKAICDSGAALIQDILDINHFESSEDLTLTRFELNHFLADLLSNYQVLLRQKNLAIVCEHDPNVEIHLYTDQSFFTRIIDNLMTNAIKFSPKDRKIYIDMRNDFETNDVKIEICDEGPGFMADDLQHLFKKFKRLSARPTNGEASTGLGLSIVKNLVERLKGHIEVTNKAGRGACFTITIPSDCSLK
jgi:signal transduction histidine kinase